MTSPRLFYRGFTLVELLVVVSIIVVLISIIAPALGNFGRANALANAGSKVANLASLARQNAMARGVPTALVLLGDQGAGSAAEYRTWGGVVEHDREIGWTQIGRRESLPTGIIVDWTDAGNCTFLQDPPELLPGAGKDGEPGKPPVWFHDREIADGPGASAARVFLPGGRLHNPAQPAQIRLVEGHASGSSVACTRPGKENKPVNFFDITKGPPGPATGAHDPKAAWRLRFPPQFKDVACLTRIRLRNVTLHRLPDMLFAGHKARPCFALCSPPSFSPAPSRRCLPLPLRPTSA